MYTDNGASLHRRRPLRLERMPKHVLGLPHLTTTLVLGKNLSGMTLLIASQAIIRDNLIKSIRPKNHHAALL